MHHVRLGIEGIPLHGWNNYIATFVIGRGCSLDYIKQPSLRKDDTRYLALWAWTANPSAIPKVKWLTLPARGHRRRGRRGLRHRALIHLDLHEDHSKARDDDDNPPPPDIYEFTWYHHVVDGAPAPRDRRGGQRHDARRPDRRDNDDDNGGHRGRGDGRSRDGWRDRVRRSLSRNPRDRQRDDGQDRTRERSGGRRRAGNSTAPVMAPLEIVAAGADASSPGSRGRSPARSPHPHTTRRFSRDNLTPTSSPTSVLPHTPGSNRSTSSVAANLSAVARAAVALCSAPRLVSPLPSMTPERPSRLRGAAGPGQCPSGRSSGHGGGCCARVVCGGGRGACATRAAVPAVRACHPVVPGIAHA